jgi:hypothetical protein
MPEPDEVASRAVYSRSERPGMDACPPENNLHTGRKTTQHLTS